MNYLSLYFVNEKFDKLITFPKGSTQYQFFLLIGFCKRLMFPWFGEEICIFLLTSISGRDCALIFCFLVQIKVAFFGDGF